MKVLIINEVCGIGSTGKISAGIAREFLSNGNNVRIAYGRTANVPSDLKNISYRIGGDFSVRFHALMTRLTDKHGFYSRRATKKFLKFASEYNPDLVWMHNIHGYFINVEMLFDWIKSRPDMQVKWTLHDCWSFTGHCAFFTMAKCEKWKNQCCDCPETSKYPKAFISNARKNYQRKKKAFVGVKNMEIITPSKWLAGLVKESFLKEYPVSVVYNTIDENIFKPTESDFREKHSISDKKMVLFVANNWHEERKGLKDVLQVHERLGDNYAIVIVGVDNEIKNSLPPKIIAINKTNGQKELAQIYTTADVFVNTTYEDNYPTVNLESRSCGTPVITYRTGGSVESVREDLIVEVGDIDGLVQKIKTVAQDKTKFL